MVLIYTPKLHQNKKMVKFTAEVQSLDYQGLGVAKINGKTWFIENALPNEHVAVQVKDEKSNYGIARVIKVIQESPYRQNPICPHYGVCGGCQGQHLPVDMHREAKEQALWQRLSKQQSSPIKLMPMVKGAEWGYRRRVRLSMRFNPKTSQVELGFRAKGSERIVAIQNCAVAEKSINYLIPFLKNQLKNYSQPKQLGHIELVVADNGVAILLRHREINSHNLKLWQEFAQEHNLNFFLHSDDGIKLLCGEMPYYILNNLRLSFDIRDFIQINSTLNQQMVDLAINWLDLQPSDQVLDLFCGMGNFTLPIATKVQRVVGIEGVEEMVQKSRANGEFNQIHNMEFYSTNLEQPFEHQPWAKQNFNKILLDPPRSGALFALKSLCELGAEKILYVSCNPATLVRDVEIMRPFGYEIVQTAMIDMFPQTGHLESITLLAKTSY